MDALTIGRLAATGEASVETVRYYQRRGLMAEPPRNGGVRRYGPDDVRRLRFIRSAQAAGFSLEEIGELLRLDTIDDRAQARALTETRIAVLDARIAQMQEARSALVKLAGDCAAGRSGPCPILTAFER
jgi:MerR family mercuric resistance operon transcriptional regulator